MIKIDLYQLNGQIKLYPVDNYIKIHHREYELNCKQEKKNTISSSLILRNKYFNVFF